MVTILIRTSELVHFVAFVFTAVYFFESYQLKLLYKWKYTRIYMQYENKANNKI